MAILTHISHIFILIVVLRNIKKTLHIPQCVIGLLFRILSYNSSFTRLSNTLVINGQCPRLIFARGFSTIIISFIIENHHLLHKEGDPIFDVTFRKFLQTVNTSQTRSFTIFLINPRKLKVFLAMITL